MSLRGGILLKKVLLVISLLTLTYPFGVFKVLNHLGIRGKVVVKSSSDDEPPLNYSTKKHLFIFGLGYVGLEVASTFLKDPEWRVSGTTTSIGKAKNLRERGINTFLFDDTLPLDTQDENVRNSLKTVSHILLTIPPTDSSKGDPVMKRHLADILGIALADQSPLKWIGYLSSTGVYGECGGNWVDESVIPQPNQPKTRARADAEQSWRRLHTRSGLPIHTFRIAGIYGPGRSALDTIRKAGPRNMLQCNPDDQAMISRIHVADICSVLRVSMENPSPGLLINVADDVPTTRYEVLAFANRLLGYTNYRSNVNAGIKENEGSSRFSRQNSRSGSKRVDNTAMRKVLLDAGVELKYPDYRSGLEAISASTNSLSADKETSVSPVPAQLEKTPNTLRNNADMILDLEKRLKQLEEEVAFLRRNNPERMEDDK